MQFGSDTLRPCAKFSLIIIFEQIQNQPKKEKILKKKQQRYIYLYYDPRKVLQLRTFWAICNKTFPDYMDEMNKMI